MSGNARSERLGSRLEGLAPAELLALARAAVGRYAEGGGSSDELFGIAREAVRRAAGRPLDGSVDDGALVDSVATCHRLETGVHAEKLRRIGEVERREAYRGRAHNGVNLWVARLGVSRGEAKTLVDSAGALERMPEVAARHADGQLGAGHVADAARTVSQLGRLADDEDAAGDQGKLEETVAALDRLVAGSSDGRDGDPGADRPLGRQALRQELEVFRHERAPDLLAEREARLRAGRSLRLQVDNGDPDRTPKMFGNLAPTTFAKARAMVHALARQHDAGDPRTFDQRCHDAFDRILDLAGSTGLLPDITGDQPRVLLLVRSDTLHDAPGAPAARLDGYGDVSNATAKLLCCDAETTRVVLGDGCTVLDVGRDRRKPNRAQRRGVFARDGACIGCGAPLAYCQVHHIEFWSDGGRTDIDNLVAVCWDCHHRIHHAGWQVIRQPDGRYRLRSPGRARSPERLAG